MPKEKESNKSLFKWVLIGVIILSGIMLLYVTIPNDIRAARQLHSRGFEIEYSKHNDTIWQHPACFLWGHPVSVRVDDHNMTQDDSRLICQLSGLETLGFSSSDISGLNWDEFGHCRKLDNLGFHDVTGFSISEIQKLAACPITFLQFYNVQLKDSDLENIMGLKQLEYLDLHENIGITDASFEYLEKIASLEILYLVDTSVTEEGIKEFKKKRPDVKVYSDFE